MPEEEKDAVDAPREDRAEPAEDPAEDPAEPAEDPAEDTAEPAEPAEDRPEPAEDRPEPAKDRAGSAEPAKDASPAKSAGRRRFSWWWLLPAAMVVEFWIYGHDGYVDVCVGKDKETDFALVGQPRTDENRWRFPRCESRTNLGLRSNYDERVEEATKVACRGATLFRFQGEAKACEAGEGGWQRQVTTRFCPPWDPAYYEHLFWFLK